MAVGNFSNGGVDTFDPIKQYIGIRLQQGVPLLDRDWNELEDIRRHYERMLREHYVGDGVPDEAGFKVSAPAFAADDDVVILPGRASVDGYDVENLEEVLYSQQGDRVPLPAARPGMPVDSVALYLEPVLTRVDGGADPDLRNGQDIAIETCVRDRLDWAVRAAPAGAEPPPGTLPLAVVTRRAGVARPPQADIRDTRRTLLNLATTLDRLAALDTRIQAAETTLQAVRDQVDGLQHDVNELFWEVSTDADRIDALFGAKATVTVTVRNRNQVAVRGAKLALSTDWGTLPTTTVSTDANGKATFELVGVQADTPFHLADIGVLQAVTEKVTLATLKNPGAVQYAKVSLSPNELAMVSKYTPPLHLVDVAREIPSQDLVARPIARTATVSVYATEASGAIVRGVGSVQVRFGFWMRDWVRTKLRDVVDRVKVDARVSDALRRAVRVNEAQLDLDALTKRHLPGIFEDVTDTTSQALKVSLFDDSGLGDEDLAGSGSIGQLVAQEATAVIGAAANRTIAAQITQFEQSDEMPEFGAVQAKEAKTQLIQTTSQLAAGVSQSQKQLFSLPPGQVMAAPPATVGIRGWWRDTVVRADGSAGHSPWYPNLVLWGMADVVAALLLDTPGRRGLTALALGAGDASWDTAAPPPDKARTALTSEVARLVLEPREEITFDPATGRVNVRARFGRGAVSGTLREFGLAGGSASARPGSGTLVNHVVHPPLELAEGDSLSRELSLVMDPAWSPGARNLIGSLLARRPNLRGVSHLALGTSRAEPETPSRQLAAEAARVPLGPRDLSYDRGAHTFVVRRDLPLGVGPDEVAEIGVIGGDAEDRPNTGYVLARVVPAAPVDRTRPVPLRVEIAVPLVGRLDVVVPDVEGRRVETARTRLAGAALAVVVSDGGEVPPVDVGKVLAQHPVAATVVPEGTPVTIEVGRARMVPVPPVVGLAPDEATVVLTAALLTVSADAPTRVSDRPAGVVDDTLPPPGTIVAEGTAVTMVRAEPRKAPVPDVRGLLLGEARRLLAGAGFAPGPDPAPSMGSSGTPGSVVAQDPEAGDEVAVGSPVVVTVAAPWTVTVPDLAGRPLDDLEQLLVDATAARVASLGLPAGTRALGLGRIDRRPSDQPSGTVIEQSPAAGEEAFLYGAVDVVAAAEALVLVPDLSGLDQTAAAGALAAVGLMLGALDMKSSTRASGVLGQKPVAGARVRQGSAVAVTVAVSPRVTVPDVVGSAVAVANEITVSAGLTVGPPILETPPAGEPVAPGPVLAQAPAAGSSVDAGSAVQFTIAAGVPGVVGLTVDDARRELEAAGLAMTVTERPSEATSGVIVAQDPPAGSAAPAGATVTVVVTVAARVRVPDLIDLDAGQARSELSDAGLVLAGLTSEESDRPEGRVISQKPAAGTTTARGSGVTVVLAAARATMADVPDVVGRRLDEARDRLVADGFVLGKVGRAPHGAEPDTVIAQEPPAGTALPVGSVVHLTVSSADAVVVVPDLRDRTLEVAVDLGRSAGVEVVGPQDVDPAAVVVTKQRPSPGARVPFGTTVLVQVAELAEVPEVLGRTGDEAAELLRRLGFTVTVTTQPAFGRLGTVIAQEPTAGTQVAAGSTVALIVAGRPVVRDDLIIEGGRLGRPDPIGPVINPVIDPGGDLRPINPFRSGPN